MYYPHRQQDQPHKKKLSGGCLSEAQTRERSQFPFLALCGFLFFRKLIQLNFYTQTLYPIPMCNWIQITMFVYQV